MPRRRKLGIALGGGAARGLAHLGVLKVLEESGVHADLVCGTSAGSIVGALYAGGYTWETMADVTRALEWGDLVHAVFPKLGLVRADRLETRLDELLGDRTIEELDLPFRAVTVDLASATQYVIESGPVAHAVRASCSIPGIFEPVVAGDRMLVDGGVLNDVPIDVCLEMGADYVLAVDLNSDVVPTTAPESLFGVLLTTFAVMAHGCRENHASLRPDRVCNVAPDLHDFSYHNLKRVDELIQRGEQAMREKMPELLGDLRGFRLFG